MSDTLTESLGKAFDSFAEKDTSAPAPAPEPVKPLAKPEPVQTSERRPMVSSTKDAKAPEARPTMESVTSERLRDEKGRFSSGKVADENVPSEAAVATQAPPVAAVTETPEPPVEAASAELRAPANWKPAAREKWASLPEEVKAEAIRVHQEISKTLNETAEARKSYNEIKEAIAPFEAAMRASGYTPARALQEYGQLNYTVHQGNGQQVGQMMASMLAARNDPQRAAQAIAHAISALNVDYDLLNSYLDGQPAHNAAPSPVDINAAVEQAFQQRLQQAVQQKQQQEEQAFAAKSEFFADVAPRMRAIRAADPSLSLDDAYKIACQMDPEISKVLQQRSASKAAEETAKKVAAAKAAAGVKPSPAVAVTTKPRSITDALNAAWDAHSGR